MIRNNILLAIRNFRKKKVFTLINVLGLTVGMTVSLLILTYARYELSYDKFHPNSSDIYRVTVDIYDGGAIQVQDAQCYPAVGPMALETFPEVEDYAMARHIGRLLLQKDNISFNEDRAYFASPGWLKIFDWKLLQGDPETALEVSNRIVLSESAAKKYFGDEDPLGKTITVIPGGGKVEMLVTGVFENVPENAHLGFDMLISWASGVEYLEWEQNNWNGNNEFMYLLSNGSNLTEPSFVDKFNDEFVKRTEEIDEKLAIQKLTDIHLKSDKTFEAQINGSYQIVSILLSVAAFVMVIAWVNYINLATARSLDRGKEVGVRKVLGSSKAALVNQFLTESFLINLLAMILTVTCIQGILPVFNNMSGVELEFNFLEDSSLMLQLIGLFVFGSLAAGSYPSLVLSNYKPLKVLTGRFKNSSKGIILRKGLVVFQFIMTMLLLVGTITIYRQINHMRSQELGINIDQTIVIKSPIVLGNEENQEQKRRTFKSELLKLSAVDKVTFSQTLFGQGTIDMSTTTSIYAVDNQNKGGSNYYFHSADADFVPAFEINVLAGRGFDENLEQLQDSARYTYKGILVNETARRLFGFESNEEAIGKRINRWGSIFYVNGVLQDYNHHSMKSTVDPTVIFYDKYGINGSYLSIKVNGGLEAGQTYKRVLSEVQNTYDQIYPESDFDYYFLDEQFNQQYKADQQFGQVFGTFAGFAIFISILGLFGLVLFEVQQRMKEIGVRKVLGATPAEIIQLFSKTFLKLIGVAILMAIPISYFGMQEWLNGYASRISISWFLFILPAVVLILVALGTIAIQAQRAARKNPIVALRYE
jgi:putative ABC transport system permease protein